MLLSVLGAGASERIHVITDRSSYIAGDLVYCSLFCVDENGRQSGYSAVSYLELISADGTVAEAKVGLFQGRGAGCFRIPVSAPTGNYALVAYTAGSAASREDARVLAVFNTTSAARISGGVQIVPDNEYIQPAAPDVVDAGGLSLSLPARMRQGQDAVLLLGSQDLGADVSVSVYHEDGLAPSDGKSLHAFLHGAPALPGPRQGEYEGEIVYASVEGLELNQGQDTLDTGLVTAFLSSAGAPSNVYVGRNMADGRIQFFTGNIYGNRELVCEVVSMDGKQCHINLASPFVHPDPGVLPPLQLSTRQRSALVSRKASLQAWTAGQMDTLSRFLPKREDLLLEGQKVIRYHLDDYNRFPTVREICVEFVKELQFIRRGNKWQIRLLASDATDSRTFIQGNVLVMMDGVVLTDHSMLADFDAMLLEDIDIYTRSIVMGGVPFSGVVNFISKKNYVTALHFPANVRVVDFLGVSYPVAYSGDISAAGSEDLRQVLYWHPAVEIAGGSQVRIPLTAPSYPGRFRVVAEGWKADGTPVRVEYTFEVE